MADSESFLFYTDQIVTITATSYDERGAHVTTTHEARVLSAEVDEGYTGLHLIVPETD